MAYPGVDLLDCWKKGCPTLPSDWQTAMGPEKPHEWLSKEFPVENNVLRIKVVQMLPVWLCGKYECALLCIEEDQNDTIRLTGYNYEINSSDELNLVKMGRKIISKDDPQYEKFKILSQYGYGHDKIITLCFENPVDGLPSVLIKNRNTLDFVEIMNPYRKIKLSSLIECQFCQKERTWTITLYLRRKLYYTTSYGYSEGNLKDLGKYINEDDDTFLKLDIDDHELNVRLVAHELETLGISRTKWTIKP